jgi:hypothetical protein
MMTLSANAQRIGDDIMRLSTLGTASVREGRCLRCESRLGKAETVAARQSGSIGS